MPSVCDSELCLNVHRWTEVCKMSPLKLNVVYIVYYYISLPLQCIHFTNNFTSSGNRSFEHFNRAVHN